MDNFQKATRENVIFDTTIGPINVIQVWKLSLSNLEAAIKRAHAKLSEDKTSSELDFLDETKTVDKTDQLRFDVLKDVYTIKKQEQTAASSAREKKEHNEKILALIAEKQEEGLRGKSIEDLQALLQK